MQFAWLDLFEGRWLLLNGNLKYPARSWTNERDALAELKEEGWTISEPQRKCLAKKKSRQRSYGYAMVRTVH